MRITGKTESAYISKDTPMVQYLNVSFAIEGLRKRAEERENQVDNQGNPLDARVCFLPVQQSLTGNSRGRE